MLFYLDYSKAIIKLEKFKILLAIFGIIIGISVYGSIRLANESILLNFKNNKSFFGEKNSLTVYKLNDKIDIADLKKIVSISNINSIQVQNEKDIEIIKNNHIVKAKLIGIDLISGIKNLENKSNIVDLIPLLNKKACLINFKHKKNLKIKIEGTEHIINKAYSLPKEFSAISGSQNLVIVDISYFQKLNNSYNKFDKIILSINPKNLMKTKNDLENILTKDILIESPRAQLDRFAHLTKAFRLNLNFLAGISLLVAVLLIYNTTSYLCLKRNKDFATLISLGITPKRLFLYILSENIVLSIIATIIGIIGAILLSSFMIYIQANTISALYAPNTEAKLLISNSIILELLILGPILGFFGTLLPALEIYKIDLKEIFYKVNNELLFSKRVNLFFILAIILALLSYLSSNDQFLEKSLYFGFVAPSLLCFSAIAFSPVYLRFLCRLLLKYSQSINLNLAIDHILSSLKRHSIVVSAIAVAFGMFLGVSIMILSFRSTVSNWLTYIIKADVYISLPSKGANFNTNSIPKSFLLKIKNNNKIKDINNNSTLFIPFDNSRVQLAAQNYEFLKKYNSLLLSNKYNQLEREELFEKESIFISESFAKKYNYKIGQKIRVPLQNGNLNGFVKEIFTDFSQEHGVILVDQSVFKKLSGKSHVHGLAVYLKDKKEIKNFINEIQSKELKIRDSSILRKEVFEIFDKTFQITYVLKIISLLLASLVLINSLLILLIERKREFMTFKAIGASNTSLTKMIVSESILLSTFGSLLGVILSIPLSLLLVFVINKHFFGWSVVYEFQIFTVLNAFTTLLLIAIIIGLIIAKVELKNINSSLLKYE